MKVVSGAVGLKTNSFCEFIDLTEQIQKFVSQSGIKNGFVTVYSKHTTMAIRINEKEKGISEDFKDMVSQLIPKNRYYRHNDLTVRTENLVCDPNASDCLNAHSHMLHLFMGTSESIPVSKKKLILGQWQRVFAIELDCARKREVMIQVVGQ